MFSREIVPMNLCSARPVPRSTEHLCHAKHEESLGRDLPALCGLLIRLSKLTDYETLSPFPFQSSKAAKVTAPKYIRNAS